MQQGEAMDGDVMVISPSSSPVRGRGRGRGRSRGRGGRGRGRGRSREGTPATGHQPQAPAADLVDLTSTPGHKAAGTRAVDAAAVPAAEQAVPAAATGTAAVTGPVPDFFMTREQKRLKHAEQEQQEQQQRQQQAAAAAAAGQAGSSQPVDLTAPSPSSNKQLHPFFFGPPKPFFAAAPAAGAADAVLLKDGLDEFYFAPVPNVTSLKVLPMAPVHIMQLQHPEEEEELQQQVRYALQLAPGPVCASALAGAANSMQADAAATCELMSEQDDCRLWQCRPAGAASSAAASQAAFAQQSSSSSGSGAPGILQELASHVAQQLRAGLTAQEAQVSTLTQACCNEEYHVL